MKRKIEVNGVEYQSAHPSAMQASAILVEAWKRLGKPTDPFSTSGKKLVDVIIAIWEDLYPLDAKMWYAERENYQKSELSIKEQVAKQTGRSLASYPLPVFQMITATFKGFDPAERNNCMKMVSVWPQFRFANKV